MTNPDVFSLRELTWRADALHRAAWDRAAWVAYFAAGSPQLTLEDCYRRAHAISETVGISAENVRQIHEQYLSQIGSVLPHIDWIKSQFYQQKATIPSNGGASTSSSFAAANARRVEKRATKRSK